MRFSAKVIFVAIGIACASAAQADTGAAANIALPSDSDDYAKLVAQAAAHDANVDFHAMRFSYLTSAARKRGDAEALRGALFQTAKSGSPEDIRDAAIKLLSVDYTNLFGHKYLRQSCEQLKDQACADQEHFVEFGLLTSITTTGDGKTCATGWEVANIGEEYFIMAMMGAQVQSQALIDGTPSCDLLNGESQDGSKTAYYFRIDAVLADERRMLGLP